MRATGAIVPEMTWHVGLYEPAVDPGGHVYENYIRASSRSEAIARAFIECDKLYPEAEMDVWYVRPE